MAAMAGMAENSTVWQVREEADDSAVHTLLERDRVWNSFALADLLPPMRAYTRFPVAARPGEPPSALLLIIEHPDFTTVSPFGATGGVGVILAATRLPQTPLIQTPAEHRAALEAIYQPAPIWREMLRMVVTAATFRPQTATEPVTLLTVAELGEVERLLRLNEESPFRPDLLDQQSFFGLHADGKLRAIAGTHVVAEPYGIAVVGNVFTHPDARGRGYAGMVTSAVVAHLLERGCRDVVLNVFANNAPAIAVYQRLGFKTRHHVWSGQAERRHQEAGA